LENTIIYRNLNIYGDKKVLVDKMQKFGYYTCSGGGMDYLSSTYKENKPFLLHLEL